MIVKILKNSKYIGRRAIEENEFLFNYCLPLFPYYRKRLVSDYHDICIGGFPRSANSFLETTLRKFNPDLKIASHLHSPLQVIKAVEKDIPCIVVIRDPIDAISSLIVVDMLLKTSPAIRSWISFYERIWHLKDRYVIADFKDVTSNIHKVVKMTNNCFGTQLNIDSISDRTREDIFSQLKKRNQRENQPENLVAVPTEQKNKLKQEIVPLIRDHAMMNDAKNLYSRFMSLTQSIDG